MKYKKIKPKKNLVDTKKSDLSTLSIGNQIINIPKSISKQIKINQSNNGYSYSLIVTRLWIEKKKDRYLIHLGDLNSIAYE